MNRRQFVLGLGGTVALGVTGLNALSTDMTMKVKAQESTDLDDSFVFTGTSGDDFDNLEITFTDFTINLENELTTDLNVTVNAELDGAERKIYNNIHELENDDEIELEGVELINENSSSDDNTVFTSIEKPENEDGELIVSDEERMEFTLTFNLEEVDNEENSDEFEETFELRLTISSIEDEIIAQDDNNPVLLIIDGDKTEVDLIDFYDDDEIEDELVTILDEKPAVL